MLRLVSKENKKTFERHDKKFTKLYVGKEIKDGIVENPTNLLQIFPGANCHQEKSKF